VGLRHVRGAAFLAADDEGKPVLHVAQAVEQRQVALARHAERHLHALGDERVGEDFPAVAGLQVGLHFGPCISARAGAIIASCMMTDVSAARARRNAPGIVRAWTTSTRCAGSSGKTASSPWSGFPPTGSARATSPRSTCSSTATGSFR